MYAAARFGRVVRSQWTRHTYDLSMGAALPDFSNVGTREMMHPASILTSGSGHRAPDQATHVACDAPNAFPATAAHVKHVTPDVPSARRDASRDARDAHPASGPQYPPRPLRRRRTPAVQSLPFRSESAARYFCPSEARGGTWLWPRFNPARRKETRFVGTRRRTLILSQMIPDCFSVRVHMLVSALSELAWTAVCPSFRLARTCLKF